MAKCRLYWVLPLLLMSCHLTSKEEAGTITSADAVYDGNVLRLRGNVVLDHGLGIMHAEEASMERQEGGKEFPFSMIQLSRDVLLEMREGATAHCEVAHLDFSGLRGRLCAKSDQKVRYIDTLYPDKAKDSVLTLSSNTIDVDFERLSHPVERSGFSVREICALGDVTVEYAHTFILHGGKAIFHKMPSHQQQSIAMLPADSFSRCQVLRDSDLLDADRIEMDLSRALLTLHRPAGVLSTYTLHGETVHLQFSADSMIWDHHGNHLYMVGNVQLDEPTFGRVQTEKELILTQTVEQGCRKLVGLRALGKTSTLFHTHSEMPPRTLTTYGSITLDHLGMQADVDSPVTEGQILPEQQVYYEEERIAVYADKAHVDYAYVAGVVHPTAISMRGHIRLISSDASKPLRFGLADWVAYSPTTRTFILGAHPGGKVLFWDEQEGVQISAQEVHLTRDHTDLPETVKGVGKVQCSFTADEEALLKKIFGCTE